MYLLLFVDKARGKIMALGGNGSLRITCREIGMLGLTAALDSQRLSES